MSQSMADAATRLKSSAQLLGTRANPREASEMHAHSIGTLSVFISTPF